MFTVEKSQAIGLSTERLCGVLVSLCYHVSSVKANVCKQHITYIVWEVLIQESNRSGKRVLNSYVHGADFRIFLELSFSQHKPVAVERRRSDGS